MIASGWKPDRNQGIFETLLVVAGEPVELEAHLSRLARSLEVLYSQELPTRAEDELRHAAEGIPLGRLRIAAVPAEDGLRVDLLAEGVESEAVFPERGVRLRTHPIGGGLGAHKWVHRTGIDRPAAGESGALIVDEGEVLEAGWANIFAFRGGTLFTPPLDGRLLPGTTRAALLEMAAAGGVEAHARSLASNELHAADEVFLTGSIRGIEAALELDGEPLAGCGPLSNRLAAVLRQRWGLASELDAPQSAAAAPILGQPAR